jgi:hypothetical protein
MTEVGQGTAGAGLPVFSERLMVVLDSISKGQAPNSGRFCGYCYTPLDPARRECPNCAKAVEEWRPVSKIPTDVLAMFESLRKRESLVVNSFAYLGLLLAVVIFIVVFYFIFMAGASLWWFAVDTLLLFVGARVLAGLLGGYVGDELGFRYARRKLAEEWAAFEAARAAGRQTAAI